jgi:hypothetical protein
MRYKLVVHAIPDVSQPASATILVSGADVLPSRKSCVVVEATAYRVFDVVHVLRGDAEVSFTDLVVVHVTEVGPLDVDEYRDLIGDSML